jgi:endonuclease/exonuclease/phosphatase family metal-dependent hydrolase
MKSGQSFVRLSFLGILSIFSWLILVSLLFAALAAYTDPADYQIFAVFGLFFPVLFLINLVLLVFWFAFKRYMLFLHLIMLAITLQTASAYFAFNSSAAHSREIKVITYNVHGFRGYAQKLERQALQQEIANFLSNQQADVACIQEFLSIGQASAEELAWFVSLSDYKYYHFEQYWTESGNKLEGLLIMSKLPIEDNGSLSVKDQRTFATWADIMIETGQTLRIYNAHLASFRLRHTEVDFIGDGQFIDREKVRELGQTVFKKFIQSFSMRSNELKLLQQHSSSAKGASLLCGDLNDTPSSYTYRQLRKSGFHDSFKKAGNGFGSTFAGNIPLQRIDYILNNIYLKPTASKVHRLSHSNHYAVSSVFDINLPD